MGPSLGLVMGSQAESQARRACAIFKKPAEALSTKNVFILICMKQNKGSIDQFSTLSPNSEAITQRSLNTFQHFPIHLPVSEIHRKLLKLIKAQDKPIFTNRYFEAFSDNLLPSVYHKDGLFPSLI